MRTEFLFRSYPFAKTDPLSPAAAATSGAVVIPLDSITTKWAAHHAHKTCGSSPPETRLCCQAATRVLNTTTNHSLLLLEEYTMWGQTRTALDLPCQHSPSPPQWFGGFRQILQGFITFFLDSQFTPIFLTFQQGSRQLTLPRAQILF